MNEIKPELIQRYVEQHIGEFHQGRIDSLNSLKLADVLKRKNPYLFRAKNMLTSEMIVRGFIDAHISSNEETIFGTWLEGLAIYINSLAFGGKKSGIPGIDLEFDENGKRYIVNIKSGPNWGNSSQIKKMINDFTSAKRTLRTSNSHLEVVAVNGCCYGRDNKPDKGDYYKYCGQRFWSFISGDENLYTDIIEPLGHNARIRNNEYNLLHTKMINKFTKDFSAEFCKETGEIDWEKLVQYNSAIGF
ncbi:MAG: PmeII family type II restriction endonuclease [Anaerolineaceae bacterium]